MEIVTDEEAKPYPDGTFNPKGVKKLIAQCNKMYINLQVQYNRKQIHSKVIGQELTLQLLEKYPYLV